MKLHVVVIALGKAVFHLVRLDSAGKGVIPKKRSRASCWPSLQIYRCVSDTFPLLMPFCTICHFPSQDRSTRRFLTTLSPADRP
jgi:hypothetical protein